MLQPLTSKLGSSALADNFRPLTDQPRLITKLLSPSSTQKKHCFVTLSMQTTQPYPRDTESGQQSCIKVQQQRHCSQLGGGPTTARYVGARIQEEIIWLDIIRLIYLNAHLFARSVEKVLREGWLSETSPRGHQDTDPFKGPSPAPFRNTCRRIFWAQVTIWISTSPLSKGDESM